LPGTNLNIAATRTAKKATYVRNWSEVRCLTYTAAEPLSEAGLQEEDGQRPREVDQHEEPEDHPRADPGGTRMANVLANVPIPDERARRPLTPPWFLGGHQKIFSITSVG
jgi:hypothetical protein